MVWPELFQFEMRRTAVRDLCTQLQSRLEQDPLDPEATFATFNDLRAQVQQCLWEPYSSKGYLSSENPAESTEAGSLCNRLKECFTTQLDISSTSKAFFFLQGAVVDIFKALPASFGDDRTRKTIAEICQTHEALEEAALVAKLALDEKHRKAGIRKRFSKPLQHFDAECRLERKKVSSYKRQAQGEGKTPEPGSTGKRAKIDEDLEIAQEMARKAEEAHSAGLELRQEMISGPSDLTVLDAVQNVLQKGAVSATALEAFVERLPNTKA